MGFDFSFLATDEVRQAIRLLAIVISLLHFLVGLILYRQLLSSARMVYTNHTGRVKIAMIVYILLLAGILLFVILF
ncbi:hypothetical protein KC640_02265 [Candidatus Dojkabacteria bacterium]|uniref:Uncharacterized protein n=1 Tax=Candidatus Dojkabacteria bacterium TaxID=2099670 RepID=A0A955I7B3_9BACT|nr:hypothetical protein [Candidatus Dojkabacteria bacterium]